MVESSCLCGDIAWAASPPFEHMSHCHCSLCRKSHGAACGTYLSTPSEGFRWRRGEAKVAHYESSPGFDRPFCPRCGSVVAGAPEGGRVTMPAGCLDGDPGVRPLAHIFVASKAPWHEISDELPRFDTVPSEFGGYGVATEARPEAPAGRVRGSCMCDAVAFELEEEPGFIVNCHCSRCRKSRAAAHGSNAILPHDKLRWLRGEERVRRFAYPGAEFFNACFCEACGALMPRVDPGRGLAIVPAGSLDQDPGARERLHIFVASKAPWHEISDELPRFEEGTPGD